MKNIDFNTILFKPPSDLETFEIESRGNVLIIREPMAIDFAIVESLAQNPNMHQRTFALALRLAISYNSEPGVTETDIAGLDRKGYKRLMELTVNFFLAIAPDISQSAEFLSKYLPAQQQQLSVNSNV